MAEAVNSDQTVDQDEETTGEKTETLDKWLLALKEDLASWISRLLKIEITVGTFTRALESGVIPCRLANFIQNTGEQFFISNRGCKKLVLPRTGVTFKQKGASQGSFIARDNVCNFIRWCRELGIPDIIMFETEDLVSNKNEKAVLLTLLEVARRAFRFGVDPPELVRLENEIDKELQNEPEPLPEKPVTVLRKRHKSHSLDDLVYESQQKCTCPTKYPVQRIADGKYRMGESKNLIFVRVMRKHVMVRVGGGWDTLDRYFEKHDPCRFAGHSRRSSKTSPRPSSASLQCDSFARSPSSTSMASVSSSESYESTGTSSSRMSTTQQVAGRRSHSPRNRTLSGGTNSPTYDRCLSPRRGSNLRHKSPCNRGTPPRTFETQGNLLSKSKSMQDLARRRGSEPIGIGSNIPVTRRRPSSARRSSTTLGTQDSRTPASTSGQRRRSSTATPRIDSGLNNSLSKKQPVGRGNTQGTTATRMHHRSKSMQELNHIPSARLSNTTPNSPRKSRLTSSKPRASSATPDRSKSEGPRNAPSSSRRASTSIISPRKYSNSISSESPRRQAHATGSPINSPRRSSSTPRGTCASPVSSPRISRRKSSTPRQPTLVNSPAPMRRAISNLSPSATRGVTRSASFGSKKELVSQLQSNRMAKQQSPRQQLSRQQSPRQQSPRQQSPRQQSSRQQPPKQQGVKTGISGIPRPKGPVKQSKVPLKVPGKQSSPAKSLSTSFGRSKQGTAPQSIQNGSPRKIAMKQDPLPPHDPYMDIPTPFDNYSYTSEDTSSLISDKDDIFLASLDSEFNAEFGRGTDPSNGSTPDTVKTPDSFLEVTGDGVSTTASEYDYLDCESDVSGIKSPRSISSGYSYGLSPTKDLLMDSYDFTPLTEEEDDMANVGILERLKSLNVEQSSVRPTLRGKIFTQSDQTAQQSNLEAQQAKGTFSAAEYMQKEPEERSKFFDIEKEFPDDMTDGNGEAYCPESPRKYSLVHALIGSIEKRNESRPTQRKKKSDWMELDGNDEKSESNLSGLPTETRPGGETVTGSCASAQDCKMDLSLRPSFSKDEAHSDNLDDDKLDENFNLRSDLANGIKTTEKDSADREYTSNNDGITKKETNEGANTGSPKHKELVLDSYPRVQQQCSLDDMIEDMLPNESGKEPAFQALI